MRRQSGLSLVELIIALAIISLIGAVVVMAVHQLLTASRQANDQQYAVSQLRQAEHWITRDALMAQTVTVSGIEFLQISWTTHDGVVYDVAYTLENMPTGSLKRIKRVAQADNQQDSSQLFVADRVDATLSSTSFVEGVLSVTLAATSGLHTETRIFEVKPRSSLVQETG